MVFNKVRVVTKSMNNGNTHAKESDTTGVSYTVLGVEENPFDSSSGTILEL